MRNEGPLPRPRALEAKVSTAADRVFEQTVSEILGGSLRPGQQISERYLVTRFGVSRTPVREAIKRLFARGLVEVGPKRVAVVAEIDEEDVHKLYAVRLMIEGYAAALTAANITAREIAELRKINRNFSAALKRRDLARMLEVRAEFHAVTAAATHNRWLAEIMAGLRERAYAVRHLHWQDPDRAAQTVTMHDLLIQALETHDAKRYRDLVVCQIRAALDCYDAQLLPRTRRPHSARPARLAMPEPQPKVPA
jgi:DNA-binding GntR family transcriptional regulator